MYFCTFFLHIVNILILQIAEQFAVIGKVMNLKLCVVTGGMDMMIQGQELARKPHIVIATPGRFVCFSFI